MYPTIFEWTNVMLPVICTVYVHRRNAIACFIEIYDFIPGQINLVNIIKINTIYASPHKVYNEKFNKDDDIVLLMMIVSLTTMTCRLFDYGQEKLTLAFSKLWIASARS